MRVYRYLSQSKKNTLIEWKIFQGFFKKILMKRLSFIIQFKIEFLLLFTGCRKVLGQIPELVYCCLYFGGNTVCSEVLCISVLLHTLY